MNTAYAYNAQETSAAVISRIYYLLELNQWSVKTLSDKSNIPYETLKKLLARKIENTSIHNIIKIAAAFHCNIDDLVCCHTNSRNIPKPPLPQKHVKDSIYTNFGEAYCLEIDYSLEHCKQLSPNLRIPLINPASHPLAVALKDIPRLDTLDISSYPEEILQKTDYGIILSTYCYHPVYCYKDILLVSRKRFPLPGETAILLHHGEVYIRRFCPSSSQIMLESLNSIGPDIKIQDFSDWTVCGYVTGVYRP